MVKNEGESLKIFLLLLYICVNHLKYGKNKPSEAPKKLPKGYEAGLYNV